MTDVKNVVLVHGGFVDRSGRTVYDLLKADGFNVSVVQNQTLSLASDVQTTHNVLDLQDGPAILVGHSYGGVVITEAGRHERVAGLAYIAAFAPDAGESVNALIADPPPGAPVPPILPPQDGFLFWTARSSPRRSRRTSRRSWRRSWPTRRSRGASRRSTALSASQRGVASRAGTWSRPTTT
jgi:pimeloyl-ACP methyl ester carboxylesterase